MLGDHYIWGKQTVYDPAFHVPLIIRDPKSRSTAGTMVNALTESIDLAPTIPPLAPAACRPRPVQHHVRPGNDYTSQLQGGD